MRDGVVPRLGRQRRRDVRIEFVAGFDLPNVTGRFHGLYNGVNSIEALSTDMPNMGLAPSVSNERTRDPKVADGDLRRDMRDHFDAGATTHGCPSPACELAPSC